MNQVSITFPNGTLIRLVRLHRNGSGHPSLNLNSQQVIRNRFHCKTFNIVIRVVVQATGQTECLPQTKLTGAIALRAILATSCRWKTCDPVFGQGWTKSQSAEGTGSSSNISHLLNLTGWAGILLSQSSVKFRRSRRGRMRGTC